MLIRNEKMKETEVECKTKFGKITILVLIHWSF